jgi:hypothetical protein
MEMKQPNKRIEPMTSSAGRLELGPDVRGALLVTAHPGRWAELRMQQHYS